MLSAHFYVVLLCVLPEYYKQEKQKIDGGNTCHLLPVGEYFLRSKDFSVEQNTGEHPFRFLPPYPEMVLRLVTLQRGILTFLTVVIVYTIDYGADDRDVHCTVQAFSEQRDLYCLLCF